ncbi:hypothetical protein JHK86_009741 [Glycine max]|nr:hypothetical protein JHK86_009741 [Glycine max]
MLEFCTCLSEARGIIMNSFEKLEPTPVDVVTGGACFPDAKCVPGVYYIGPLIMELQQSKVP